MKTKKKWNKTNGGFVVSGGAFLVINKELGFNRGSGREPREKKKRFKIFCHGFLSHVWPP